MQIEIKHRLTGSIIHAGEYVDVREAVVAAAKAGADLSGANLSGAYLSGANLTSADLTSAYLSGADLRGANLTSAYLRGANLSGARLTYAYLSGADLRGANLTSADLTSAYLSGADLRGANLTSANLTSADLRGAKGINPHRCTPLLMLYDQPGRQRAYKIVTAQGYGIYRGPDNGGIKYEIGQTYSVPGANTDADMGCGAGINVATLDWCMREWQPGYRILVVEFAAKDIAAIPTATDGKFRLHRCKVVAEKNLAEIGLVESEEADNDD